MHRAFSLLTRFAALTCAAGAMDDALPASNVRKVIKARRKKGRKNLCPASHGGKNPHQK